jgi:hypothetical protein
MEAGPMGGPDRPWVPPGAGPHPPGAEPVRGAPIPTGPTRDEPPAGPRRRRWPLLAGAAAVVVAGVLLVVLVVDRQRGPDRAPPTTDMAGTAVQQPLRVPETLGDFRRVVGFDQLPTMPQSPDPLAGVFVAAAYAGPDRQSGLVMTANRAGVVEGGPQEAAEHWAGGAFLEETPTFEPFPRDGLDIRCARSGTGAVCYVDGPRLEVVMTGSPTASRMASLLTEAYRKMLG